MNYRKLFAIVVSVILVMAACYGMAFGQDNPTTYRFLSGNTEDTSPSPSGTAVAQSAGVDNCGIGCGNVGCVQSCYSPRWTATADFIIFDRIGTKSQTLVDRIGATTDEALNSNDFNLGFRGGPRVSLIRHGNRCYDIELMYFQIDGWSSTRRLEPNGDVLEFSAPGGFAVRTTTDPMQFDYSSKLYNGELNLRWNPTCRITLLAGFRWVELRENLNGALVPATVESFWNTNAKNDLYGFQIGTDAKLWEYGRFSIDGLVKAGIFNNHAEQTTSVNAGATIGSFTDSTNHAAFLGEVGLQCKYEVTCNLTLRAGYEAIWIDGLALAPGQIPVTNVVAQDIGIDANGGVFYHGATAGFEYKF